MSCWDILGLPPGMPPRDIKRRFAQLVKTHRPEEDPHAYQRLRDAYEAALLSVTSEVESAGRVVLAPAITSPEPPVRTRSAQDEPQPVAPPSHGWPEALASLFAENERNPEAAGLQLEKAMAAAGMSDLKALQQFEMALMEKLARNHQPLLLLAAVQKFKWYQVTKEADTGTQSRLNDQWLLYQHINQAIAPCFFNHMSCIDEGTCGENLFETYNALQHDPQSEQWFDIAVLLKLAEFTLSADYVAFICERLNWSIQAADQNGVLTWTLSDRFHELARIHQHAQGIALRALNLEAGCYHASKVLTLHMQASELGHPEACFFIGRMYELGHGVCPDEQRAIHWHLRAAEQGLASAQYHLALIYEYKRNYSSAARWYSKAAEQGGPSAQYSLGRLYTFGLGVTRNYQQAIHWYTLAADQNDHDAQYALGTVWLDGQGVEPDYQRSHHYFSQAARLGNKGAYVELAKMYFHGQGCERNISQALFWYNKSADQNDGQAQYCLGKFHLEGEYVSLDFDKALAWFSKAAENGSAEAMFELGQFYFSSEHVPADYEQAVLWFTEAGQRGVTQAAYLLAEIYAQGKGSIGVDEKHARYWYEKAAYLGSTEAQKHLAAMYANGTGKKQNYVEAWAWIIISRYDNSHIDTDIIRQQLSVEEQTEAEMKAARYIRIFQLRK